MDNYGDLITFIAQKLEEPNHETISGNLSKERNLYKQYRS